MASQGYDVPHQSLTVEPDEDDDLVAYSSASLHPQPTNGQLPPSSTAGKGKGRGPAGISSGVAGGVSGSIGGAATGGASGAGGAGAGGSRGMRQQIGGIMTETRYSGMNTLDEPVIETIMRDLSAIGQKMILILYPSGSGNKALLREWDLWGPLVACLGLAVILSLNAPPKQSLAVFTGVFVIVWLGSLVVTLNARLLGGKVSLFQSLCVLGYCLFPIMVAALVALFVHFLVVRVVVGIGGWLWSVWAAMNFFSGTRLEDGRTFLAVYPILLLYAVLSFLVIVG